VLGNTLEEIWAVAKGVTPSPAMLEDAANFAVCVPVICALANAYVPPIVSTQLLVKVAS
jgi:hypothetical protein